MDQINLRGYSREEFERQFNPRVAVPDHQVKIDGRKILSNRVRASLNNKRDVRYGPNPNELLDIYPAINNNAPVQLYIHGGYWRAQDKSDVAFIAEPFVSAGATMILMNYDLCPFVNLDEIVAETIRAISWIYQNINDFGGDRERIFVSGSSAGAHLCAMAIAHDWLKEGLPPDIIKGAAPSTGIYDIEPVLGLSVNSEIGLTPDMVHRLSPIYHPPKPFIPIIVSVGSNETDSWIQQSLDYAYMSRDNGNKTTFLKIDEADHFDMVSALGESNQPLFPAIRQQMGI